MDFWKEQQVDVLGKLHLNTAAFCGLHDTSTLGCQLQLKLENEGENSLMFYSCV